MRKTPADYRVSDALVVLAIMASALLAAPAHAMTLTFTDMRAVLSTTIEDDGSTVVSLLANSDLFGDFGFAGGQCQIVGTAPPNPCRGSGVPPDPILWQVTGGTPPDDQTPIIGFIFDRLGAFSGIDPSPFRLFVSIANGAGPVLFGELDFGDATAMLGSLILSNVVVNEVDADGQQTGVSYDVNAFTIQAVPLPTALPLLLTALGALGVVGWRSRRKAAA